jgi:hypothetical protein
MCPNLLAFLSHHENNIAIGRVFERTRDDDTGETVATFTWIQNGQDFAQGYLNSGSLISFRMSFANKSGGPNTVTDREAIVVQAKLGATFKATQGCNSIGRIM